MFLKFAQMQKVLIFFAHPCSSLAFLFFISWVFTEVWKLLLQNFSYKFYSYFISAEIAQNSMT